MKLEIEGEVIGKSPSSEAIAKALSSLDGENKSFAILERDKLTYIQASGSVKDGFSLEYQNGSTKEHYCCPTNLSSEEATKVFQSYAKGGKEWQAICDWKPMKTQASGFNQKLLLFPILFAALAVTAGFLDSIKKIDHRFGLSLFFVF